MKKRISALVLIDLLFLLLLIISGTATGALRWVLYFLAYILPIGIGVLLLCKYRLSAEPPRLALSKERTIFSGAIFAPTMLSVIGLSALTALILSFFGKTNEVDVSGNLLYVLFRHALVPAAFEELLFRFIPIKILLPYSKRGAIGVSALLFALIHLNLFQIPYALLAGAVFGFLTVASGSILPCVLLHFLNNLVSVVWMRNPEASPVILAAILLLCIPSVIYIIRKRSAYAAEILGALDGERIGFSIELLVMTVLCIIMSVVSL